MQITAGPLLQSINSPDDLKKIPKEQLHQVCDELRTNESVGAAAQLGILRETRCR